MKALDRKLLRDLARMKGQAITIALVVAAGVASFIAPIATWRSLTLTRAAYYATARFADVWADVKRAPEPVAARLAEIPGVAEVETRLVYGITLEVAGVDEPVSARLISIPDSGEPSLGRLHVKRGALPVRADEVAISEGFAKANGLGPGDALVAVINGRKQRLTVAGIALSPEWVYVMPPGAFVGDDRKFGVLWMRRAGIAAAFDARGVFDEIAMKLAPAASTRDVIGEADRILEPYGAVGAYGRKDQPSHILLDSEIKQQRSMALVMPLVFFGISTFLLQAVLMRLVSTQRAQIASLKALGYDSRRIGVHYLELVLAIVLAGAAAGVAVGAWLGVGMTRLYVDFFRFPVLSFRLDPWVPLAAAAVSVVSGVAGTLGAVWRVIRLPAAEAMRPEAPPLYRAGFLERIGLGRLVASQGRMVLRGLTRRPGRAALTTVGVAASVAILVGGRFSEDAVDYLVDVQFDRWRQEELDVTFRNPLADSALGTIDAIPGVRRAEGFRAVPVRLHAGHHRYLTSLFGFERGGELRHLVDQDLSEVPVPSKGVVLGARIVERLGLAPGDPVRIEVLDGRGITRTVPVAAVIHELVGNTCAMDRRALASLLGETPVVDGAAVSVDPRDVDGVMAKLQESPAIASAERTGMSLKTFMKVNARLILVMSAVLTAFASAIAVGVVYNAARLALAERARDLVSLRVLGFTRAEVSFLLLAELAIEFFAGLPLGCVLGYGLVALAAWAFSSDLMVLPVVIRPSTYAFAIAVVVLAGVASALVVRRMLDRLDLVSVLKTAEE